ncbi:MAG: aminotransferase class IV [Bacteroidetes bacterium]|nr:aminotransferase class IV [Bacteroidota bacterium]
MSACYNYNGQLLPYTKPSIFPNDKALRFGYGIYESMLLINGEIRLEEMHWARLMGGLKLLEIHHPKDFQSTLHAEVLRTVNKNKLADLCRIRLQINAGQGSIQDDNFSANYLIECMDLERTVFEFNSVGWNMGISSYRKQINSFAHLKTASGLQFALAAREAKKLGWDDALILNEADQVVESCIANIYWIKDSVIYTPSLASGCVTGVIRRYLIERLPKMGFECKFVLGTVKDLEQADELFLTNAIRSIIPISRFQNKQYNTRLSKEIHAQLFA